MAEQSIGGFFKYLANGKRVPEEVAADEAKAAEAKKNTPIEKVKNKESDAKSKIDAALAESGLKKGGRVKMKTKYCAKGGKIDGCAVRGKTRAGRK